ncbi:MAG: manganese efflux pump MntP family protein [Bacteroidota bacterium]
MDLLSIILIAIGLSADTFAVSVSTGLVVNNIRFWQGVRFALVMAILQTLMPFAGWFAGSQVASYISNYDHWIAFGLLSVLGIKMILESFKKDKEESSFNPLKLTVMLGIAIATSIDALVVGVSFAMIQMNIYLSILIIGFVTFLVSMIGMLFGKKVGSRFGKRMEIIGGIILIGIGVKILLSHLY